MTESTRTAGRPARPLTRDARERLREQTRRERSLAARVLAAESRLAAEAQRREAAMAAHDRAVARRAECVADALIEYIQAAGVGVERAAMILGRSKASVAKTVRERRAALRASGESTNGGTSANNRKALA